MEILYELWLHSICNFEPEKAEKMVSLFENGKNTFSSGELDRYKLHKAGLEEEFADKISDSTYFHEAKDILNYCNKNGIRIITQESEEYPEYLKHTNTPPRILFAKGERINLNNRLMVSVVGCRIPTDQGKAMARQIGRSLAKEGIVVVSGMADGIDGEAHLGALEAGGKTVAVLAGSVDAIYPQSHSKLYYEILKNGMVLSERPPGTGVKRYFYQQRNRIVVGLSQGTVIVEGKEKSGTSITARLALDNNRDVFAVPGNPLAWQSTLPNRLISEGAIVVDKVDTPVEYYKDTRPEFFKSGKVQAEEKRKINGLSPEDEKIVKAIEMKGGIACIEDLAEICGFAPNVLASKLTILCIRGVLRQESGNRYMLN